MSYMREIQGKYGIGLKIGLEKTRCNENKQNLMKIKKIRVNKEKRN